MSNILPALRRSLDIMPSPEASRPGLLIRDPLCYTDTVLFVPAAWAVAMRYLDGEHTELDLQETLTRARGTLVFSDEIREFVGVLREQGFLETKEFYKLQEERHKEFSEQPERPATHAGTAYPASRADLQRTFEEYFRGVEAAPGLPGKVLGMAAPHVSPAGGRNCYAMTYRRLAASPALAERTFIILGTSHWGQPGKFGLTRKPFITPLGALRVDTEQVDWLAQHAGSAVNMEDYCHAIEHSIEFQCVFLQHALGPELKIIPILCGPMAESPSADDSAENKQATECFLGALAELAEKCRDQLFWVLGIDLAHIGRRYGDPFSAVANRGQMADVAEQDRQRLDRVCAGDCRGLLEAVNPGGDELKWCGYSALYTFMKAVGQVRGRVLLYQQWNIDPQSVVSFASLEFCEVEESRS
jgi:hypothetical protein